MCVTCLKLYLFLAVCFYFYHEDLYKGIEIINFIVADTIFYVKLSERTENFADLIRATIVHRNSFGPVLLYDFILQENRILFLVFIFCNYAYVITIISKFMSNKVNNKITLFLLILYPAIIPCLSGPNKEITGYLSILYFINFIINRKYRFIILSIVFAIFTRVELVLLIILWILSFKFSHTKKIFICVSLVFFLSLIIHYTGYIGIHKIDNDIREGSYGYNLLFASLSRDGLYFITIFPKILLNLFGSLPTSNILNIEGYSILLYLSQLYFFFLCLICFYKRKFSIRNDFFYFFLTYCIVFAVPPFVHHRYFLPIYPMLVILAFYTNSFSCLHYLKEKNSIIYPRFR